MSHLRHLRLHSQVKAYLNVELDAPAAGQVRVHLRECWWCSGEAQTHRLVRAALRRRRDQVTSLPLVRLRRFARGIDPSRPDPGSFPAASAQARDGQILGARLRVPR